MTHRSEDWLAAYNARRGGYAPAETTDPEVPALLKTKAVVDDLTREDIDITTVEDWIAGTGPRYATYFAPEPFTCTIPGTPTPKGRPRFDKAGHAYTPEKTRRAEAAVASCVALAGPCQFSLAVRVELDFYFKTPARMTREGVQKALQGEIRPILRVDVDNLGKLVLDAIQGHGPGKCFADDKQVAELVLRKWYGPEAKTVLRVVAL